MTDPVQIEFRGTRELLAKLEALGNFTKSDRLKQILWDAGQKWVERSQAAVPKQTRLLKSSIHHRLVNWGTDNPGVEVGVGGPGARYANYVEAGTKPSYRVARRVRWMHWQQVGGKTLQIPGGMSGTPVGGEHIFARRVHHPGTKAQPFFWKFYAPIKTRTLMLIEQALNAELAKGSGPRA
jgi:HK97 gp10 family phage protein